MATIGDAPPVEHPTAILAPTTEFHAAAPPYAPPARRTPAWRRRRGGRRVMSRVLLVAIVAAVAVWTAGVGGELFGLLREGASARAVPAEGGSLLRAVALERALTGIPDGARVETLRVTTDHLDARVVVNGRVRLVRVTSKGLVTDLPAAEKPTGEAVRVDPRAPARIVRTVTRRTNRRVTSISHVALEGTRWQLTFSDGAQFSANVHGRDVHRG
ncbi:hypothetical protein [Solirubrobacter deserti]|uniref:Uncharacterized protein n=1 Tax=Solirubrobacter deserti TaxID=2282478 RepID=A0ABT4RPC0_9ACTN|nr:hypothetical protein [Solirubrobacter deserti]MDA0140151.1 hypothetical protein [Solirubrobacter deserti]